MDWCRLPSLTALRAFAVLAERSSFTSAASALNVSHAAVIQQVRALEERLGVSLVVRAGRGVALTTEGELLARDLHAGFATIQRGVEVLTGAGAARPVQISMSPAFATEWLMPRIMEFQYRYPETTLMLNPTAEVVELRPGGIDMAVRYRGDARPPKGIEALLVSDMVVIGTPELLAGRGHRPEDLLDMPWLQELGTSEVSDWFERRGVAIRAPLTINHMPGNLIMEAVRRGDGITYTARAFFRDEIAQGRILVVHTEPAFGQYFVETAPGVPRPSLRRFLAWLQGKAERVVADPARGPDGRG